MAMTAWARPAVGVITNYLKGITEVGMRDFVQLAMMRKKGRIKYKAGGKDFNWLATFRRDPPTRSDDLEPSSFVRVNREKAASLGFITIQKGELISKGEKLMFQDQKTARYNILERVLDKLHENCMEYFNRTELYNDSSDASNADGLTGLESLFGTTTTQISNSWHSTMSSGTYAGLNQVLGAYGGEANAPSGKGYPMGTPDLAYNFWHPMIVSFTSSNLTASTKTWINTWRESQRKARTFMEAMHGKKPDIWLTDPISYEEALTSLEEKERIIVGEQDKDLVNLGFRHIKIDGIPFMSEFGCTAETCYGLTWKKMQLLSMQSQLWDVQKDFDINYSGAQKLLIDFYGQEKFESPACFAKIHDGGD